MIAVVLTALLSAAPTPSLPPTPAALRRAMEASAQAWVEVSGRHGRGPGLTVGRGGEVLAPASAVDLESAQVRSGRERVRARVLAVSGYLGTAVLRPERPLTTRAVPVDPNAALGMGSWLIAVDHAHPSHPTAVRILNAADATPFVQLADNLPVGTALFDARGALVAFVVHRQAATASAVRVSAVRAQLAPVATKDAP